MSDPQVENASASPGPSRRRCISILLLIFVLALIVRSLTGYFIREHFDDPGWFQFGSYGVFDRQAQDILDQRASIFWISDASRTDQIVYPPGYPIWLAIVYGLSGDRTPVSVQKVQLVLDSLSVLLLVGIGVSSFGWNVGVAGGVLGALSPLLALGGVTPNADAPASWFVLAAAWCLLLAAKRRSFTYAIAAGSLLGLACWLRVNPLFLAAAWSGVVILVVKDTWRRRLALSAAAAISALLVISPVVVRNLVVFYPDVAPTGLNVGWNLLAGIGETERGAEFGVPCCDAGIIEQDRAAMNLPDDAPLGLNYPDGIRRDRERGRRALTIIADHPLWFAGAMAKRTWGHLKYAGKPAPSVGSAGFNVTPGKSLPPERQGGVIALGVTVLGMVQSVWRYAALPLMIIGIIMAFRAQRLSTLLLLSTILYYMATLAIGHSEIRYGLPMQATLIVFAGFAVNYLWMRSRPLFRFRREGDKMQDDFAADTDARNASSERPVK